MNAMVVVLFALATGCTGFLTSIAVLSLTWLVPSVGKRPPEILEKPHRRTSRVQPQEPHQSTLIYKEAEYVPRLEPERHVSFDEPASIPSPAPASAPSSPRGRSIPLPRYRSCTVDSGAVALPPASAVVALDKLDNSPLSSAETLTEAPTEMKRTFSGRLTRVLPWGRSSTMGQQQRHRHRVLFRTLVKMVKSDRMLPKEEGLPS
ncbi:hypothetical protein BJV77DRAFT_190692 [Russula vinacea]|nr:hypothetical protein BJV77DRAFT_190692 [Russula vinacea]